MASICIQYSLKSLRHPFNPLINTVKTQIEEKCARTLEFPLSATRGGNTANSAPS